MLDLEQYQIKGSSAREIAASAEAGIRDGTLPPGAPMPTVRALAEHLGTSPATVNAAYRLLRERGLVRAEGRRGTHVAPRPAIRPQASSWRGAESARTGPATAGERDLTYGLPDPALLPSLARALATLDAERLADHDLLEYSVPELISYAREWFAGDGIDAGALAVVSGALDAIERLASARLRAGDRVLLEDPSYPPFRDILLSLGLVEVPVAVDERGLRPSALAEALERGADALLCVPRAQNPTGAAIDAARAAELQAVLAGHPDVLVVEDDHVSEIAGCPLHSVIAPDRERWAVIRSTSKILHPDLRVALIAGDEETIARVEGRLALGQRWVSHLLQSAAAAMLGDPEFPAICARATAVYRERRETLVAALAAHGIVIAPSSGFNVWVPLRQEAPVLEALAGTGFRVAAGERFRIASSPGVRITVTTLTAAECEQIAATIAGVERARRQRRAY